MSTSERQTFFNLLDNQKVDCAEAVVVVLRRKDDMWDMDRRLQFAYNQCRIGVSDVLLLPVGNNTLDEALWTKKRLAEWWDNIVIVTSRFHHYRAFLTFLQQLKHTKTRLYALTTDYYGVNYDDEVRKIKEYQKKGDVASYAEGIAYLRAHS